MSMPPEPPQAELLDRLFSFYPPIHGIENNEWRLKEATWSDMLVANTQSGIELGIPRRYFGRVSETDKPVMIVGLTQELEYNTGAVWPRKRRVLSMPAPPLMPPPGVRLEPGGDDEPRGMAAMLGVGTQGPESRIGKMIGITFVSVLVLVGLVWALIRFTPATRPTFVAKDQAYIELGRDDDYFAVLRKLGKPAEDRWKQNSGELQYRALVYPERGYAVILMGTKQEDARFIGAIGLGPDGKGWSPLYSVDYARGANTMGILRELRKF